MMHFSHTGSSQARNTEYNTNNLFSRRSTNTPGGGWHGNALFGSSTTGGTMIPDLPVPVRGNRTAVLHDTGVGFSILPENTDGAMTAAQSSGLMGTHREPTTHLNRSLLVRMTVYRRGAPVQVMCGSENIGRRGMMLKLPSKLGLSAGSSLDLEIFLPPTNKPVSTKATVRSVARAKGEDAVKYKVELDFKMLGGSAERDLANFIYASRPLEDRHLPI